MANCQDLVNAVTFLGQKIDELVIATKAVAINIDAQRAQLICLKGVLIEALVNREVTASHYANVETLMNSLVEETQNGFASIREAISLVPNDPFEPVDTVLTSDELLLPFTDCEANSVYCPPGQVRDLVTGQCVPQSNGGGILN